MQARGGKKIKMKLGVIIIIGLGSKSGVNTSKSAFIYLADSTKFMMRMTYESVYDSGL